MRTSSCRKEACQGCGSTKWTWRQFGVVPKPNTCSVCDTTPSQERCESCASEADLRINGICFGCLAYSLEPARMDLQPAIDNDDEYVTLRTSHVADVFHAIDTLWAAQKPRRLK